MPFRDLNVLDAAVDAARMINELIDESPRGQLLHVDQLRNAVQSIVANIREGFGREPGRARQNSLRIARSETEEAIGHVRANYLVRRLEAGRYWPIHNRLVVVSKMLVRLMLYESPGVGTS